MKSSWSSKETCKANANGEALNVIFGGVDENQFKYITMCESAKEAWNVLHTIHEGTNLVRTTKLHMLTTKFKNIKMEKADTIAIFNAKMMDIANQAFQLGKKQYDEKLVWETHRSLPKRFEPKLVAIEKALDTSTIGLDDLMGSLQAYKMNIRPEKKGEEMALKVEARRQKGLQQVDEDKTDIVLLLKCLNKLLKQILYKRSNVKRNTWKDQGKAHKKYRRQCQGCRGTGHLQNE